MNTTKPATTPTVAPSAQTAAPAPVKPEATRKAPAQKATVKKPVVKKAVPAKTPVGTVAVKAPLSKAFASAKPKQSAKAAKTVKAAEPAKAVKPEKARKPKLVRDSFTIPKAEYVVLEALKERATKLKTSVKKSELLRAGIKALAALADAAFLTALKQVPAIKTGRPAAEK